MWECPPRWAPPDARGVTAFPHQVRWFSRTYGPRSCLGSIQPTSKPTKHYLPQSSLFRGVPVLANGTELPSGDTRGLSGPLPLLCPGYLHPPSPGLSAP